MVRWLEANGYDVSYTTGVDTDRARRRSCSSTRCSSRSATTSTGRARSARNVEAARDAGVHLAFFSGNEVFWKTRWETASTASSTPYRTLSATRRRTRTRRSIPTAGLDRHVARPAALQPPTAARPGERADRHDLHGQRRRATTRSWCRRRTASMRFWRNTQHRQPPARADRDPAAGHARLRVGRRPRQRLPAGRPHAACRRRRSTSSPLYLLDYGSNYGAGTATHSLTLYRAAPAAARSCSAPARCSGRGASTRTTIAADAARRSLEMQQATVNLFADMGVQPTNAAAGSGDRAARSIDRPPPTSTIVSPPAGPPARRSQSGDPVTISGTASDNGGARRSVEVSVDGGATWRGGDRPRATGRSTGRRRGSGSVTIKSRAFDDSGNVQATPASRRRSTVSRECPCSIWGPSVVPPVPSHDDPVAIELGDEVQGDHQRAHHRHPLLQGLGQHRHARRQPVDGGRRTPLATRDVHRRNRDRAGSRSTSTTPVAITAGTTYVASYHAPNGGYPIDRPSDTPGPGFTTAIVNRAAARARRRRGRRQRRLQAERHVDVSDRHLRQDELLRGRGVPARQRGRHHAALRDGEDAGPGRHRA